MNTNYIDERLKEPRFAIYLNGKEVKRIPFYKQARAYVNARNGALFGDKVEILDRYTGEIFG